MEMKFDINEVVRNLKKNDYTVHYFKTHEEAAEYIAGRIDGKKVGFGDSKTLLGMGMVDKLKDNPENEIHHPDYPPEGNGNMNNYIVMHTVLSLSAFKEWADKFP